MAYAPSITAQKGRLLQLKLGTGASPDTFSFVTGLRATDVSINSNPIDITSKSSGGWRELLAGAGVEQIDISASGIWDSTNAALQTLLNSAIPGVSTPAPVHAEIITGGGDTFVGWWVVSAFKRSGTHNDAETFDITLESTGPITYTV